MGGGGWSLFRKVVLTIFSSFCNHLVEEERAGCFTLPLIKLSRACANPGSFVRGCPTLTTFIIYLVYEGREDLNTTKSGPSWAR